MQLTHSSSLNAAPIDVLLFYSFGFFDPFRRVSMDTFGSIH